MRLLQLFNTKRIFMRRGIVTMALMVWGLSLWAAEVGYEEALHRAERFFAELDGGAALKSGRAVQCDTFMTWPVRYPAPLKSAPRQRETAFYIFNRLDRPGFVILSAESSVKEVLAWSATSDICALPPQLEALLSQYALETGLARAYGITSPETVQGAAAEPLLKDIRWNQNPDPFNTLCPYDEATGRICPAGCVATAMAQVIYYWKYPRVGTGSFGYTSPYGYLSADFGKAEYRYEEMADAPWPGVPNPEIAELTYHCAVAVEMIFGPYSSSTYAGQVTGALEKYFKYRKPTQANRSVYSQEAWRNLIMNEINARRPVIYSALDPLDPAVPGDVAAGHAFVVDGYDSEGLFHINWGWGGCSDGYYSLDLINPSDCAQQYTYSHSHMVIAGIEPVTDFECLLSVEKTQVTFPVTGGADSLEIRANAGWAVTTDAWWLSIAPREGQGNATLVIEARANAGFLGRSGKVTVKGCGLTHEIRVVQDGTCAMEPSTGELFFEVGAGSQSFTLRSTASWMITSGEAWIGVSPDMGNGDETITVTVTGNEGGVARSGSLEITGCSVTKRVEVSQEGSCYLVPGAHSVELGAAGGTASVEILSNGEWHAETSDTWISLEPASGDGDRVLLIGAAGNEGQSKRTGTVTLRGCGIARTIQVTQQGACSLEVLPLALEFSPAASDRYVTVSAGNSWKATTAETWINLSPASGEGTAMLRISVTENKGSAARNGVVLVNGCGTVYAISLVQRSSCLFDLSSQVLDFTYMPGSKSLSVNTSSRWQAHTDDAWITLTPASGTKGGQVKVDVAMHSGEIPRTGTVVFLGCNTNRILKVEQEACAFELDDDKLLFSPEGGTEVLEINSNASWTLLNSFPWINLSATSGLRDATVTVSADGNSAEKRSGWIRISGCFSSRNVEVIQEGVSTPAGEIPRSQVAIWPSPATGFVWLAFPEPAKNAMLEIFTSEGRLVRRIPSPGKRISLDGIAPGLYLFHFTDGEYSHKEKIVVR